MCGGRLIIVARHSPHKETVLVLGIDDPEFFVAVFKADVSSGASTIPMNAPGDSLIGR
jgi:hypothetical protein